MNKFSCYTSRTGNVLPKQLQLVWRTAMLLLAAFLFSANAYGQIVFPAPDTKCVSNDMEVISASLGDDCVPCTSGSAQLEELILSVKNTTNSTRRSFTYWAVVEITDPDGNVLPLIEITGCEPGPWAGGETRSVTEEDPISFECGSTVRLINVFLAWTDASDSDRNTCEEMLANPDKINPKCGRPAEIRVTTPPANPLLTVVQPTCAVPTGSITIAVTTGLTFSVNGGAFAAYPSGGYTNLMPGTYSIRAMNAAGCISDASSATINAVPTNPAAPALSVTQPTCAVPTGTITLTPVSGLEYKLDGGAWGAYPSGGWSGLSSGSHTIHVRRISDNTCTNSASATINAAPTAPDAPSLNVTQPTCAVPTGTITLTPVSGLEYKLDGGTWGAYPSGGWSGLSAGSHTIHVRRISDNTCVNSASATIIAAFGAPAAPVLSVTQPTCTVGTGAITLTPVSGLEYRLDAGLWGAYPVGGWSGLAPGSHTVYVRRISDPTCINSSSATINDAPIVPSGVVVSRTQPTCTVATGSFTVTSPVGAIYTYSINGTTYQASPTFSGLAPGTYNLTVRSSDGCVSAAVPVVINDAPIVPSGVVVSRTQPTCTVATGSFTVTSPVGAIYTYSINGTTYQASPTFSGLAPGTYNLTVRSSDGCVSAAVPVVINDAPIVPSGVMRTVVQPTCAVPTGSITFTAPLGGIYTYSINNGSTFQASPAFSGLAAGTYNLVVRSSDGCLSTAIAVTLVAPVCDFDGCTLGYWKNHPGSWTSLSCLNMTITPNTLYRNVFTTPTNSPLYGLTLMEVLNLGGGGIYNLGRQSVAALLNACHPNVNYEWSAAEIRTRVNAALAAGTKSAAGALATELDMMNNAGCSIDAHNRPITSSTSSSVEGLGRADVGELRAYPTPFSDKATIEFTTAVDENYTVRLYDMRGALIRELKSGTAKAGVMNQVEVDGRNLPEGLYLGRVVSDSGSQTVKLLLKR